MNIDSLSESDLIAARKVFRENEARDVFYRAARELMRLSLEGQTELGVAEALGTLLQTWNQSFYRFHETFDEEHIQALEALLDETKADWNEWRGRTIVSLQDNETAEINTIFEKYAGLLGPVGAAKALHLLAPRFFPLWDREIAKCYGVRLKQSGENGEQYVKFMKISREQMANFPSGSSDEFLKMLDEYNYCRHTKGWLR